MKIDARILGLEQVKDYLPLLLQLSSESQLVELETLIETAKAEISLHEFVQQAWHLVEPDTKFVDGFHIRAICDHLEAVVESKISDLLINIPPGCCKSLLCCVFWPAWVWTTKPETRWLFASYAQELATRDSVRCRNIVESSWYQERWGHVVTLVADQNQKTRFDTTARGWRIATSVDGRGTGEHPDIVVCDDPHNVKESESDLERQRAIEWWDGTISSRGRSRGSRRVVIMQRLHERDLSGHLIAKGGFEHICLPMEFERDRMKQTKIGWNDPRTTEGELVWPELFSATLVDSIKRDMGSFRSAGQLQQRPAAREGGMFKRDWLPIAKELPAECNRAVRYWDKASTQNGGDYSAGVLVTECDGIFYVVDVIRGQWSVGTRNRIMEQMAALDASRFPKLQIWTEQEPGSGGVESAEYTIRQLAGYAVKAERSTGDKETRAAPFAAQCEAGNVRLLAGPWNHDFIDELTVFPNGANDDQVDAASGAFKKIAKRKRAFFVA